MHCKTPLGDKRRKRAERRGKRSGHPGGLQCEEKQEIYLDQWLIVPDIFPVNILYGGLHIYCEPDHISVIFLTGPTTSALSNRPSSNIF